MSGNRCGVLYTANARLLRAMEELGPTNGVSNFFQHAAAAVFEDEALIDRYLEENRANLRRSLAVLASGLEGLGVPFVRPHGGLFVWIDLRGVVAAGGASAAWINEKLVRRYRVVMTPGSMAYGEDGFFRICFASVPVTTLEELIRRLRALVIQGTDRGALVEFIDSHK